MGRRRFSPERQAAFLAALRAGHIVSEAARQSGLSVNCLYRHRRTDPGFAAAWDLAQEAGTDRLIAQARRGGRSRPRHNDRALSLMLSKRRR